MSSNLTMANAKRDFAAGFIKSYSIDRNMAGGSVFLHGQSKLNEGWLIDARQKKPRVFKSLDAAILALNQIGFNTKRLVYFV